MFFYIVLQFQRLQKRWPRLSNNSKTIYVGNYIFLSSVSCPMFKTFHKSHNPLYILNCFLFIFSCTGALLLCVDFLWLRQAGATLGCSAWLSLWWLLLLREHRLSVHWLQELQLTGPRVQARWLWCSRLSCSVACGVFQCQRANPCPLHWQADSYPPGKSKQFYFTRNFFLVSSQHGGSNSALWGHTEPGTPCVKRAFQNISFP